MHAAEDFLRKEGIAEVEGWIPTGFSKRGWTTWLIGATKCKTCTKIIGMVPMVPITPNLIQIFHW